MIRSNDNKVIKMNPETNVIINDRCHIGKNVRFGPQCKIIEIGYGSNIGDDVYIDVPELYIGEYTTVHKGNTIHGYQPLHIGHNCWIGQSCVLDSIGGCFIGNNVGIGAYSQLWSHIKFGDTLEGCKWNSIKKLIIEDDVWFVGHSIVSPIHAKKKSMLMVGGVITKDMEENHIYGGSPAKDLTDKLGMQFRNKSIEEKREEFEVLYLEFLKLKGIHEKEFKIIIHESYANYVSGDTEDNFTIYFLNERTYIPTRSEYEFQFMKYLLYDKAKFIPTHKK